ncbi:alkyl sulfatase dimerization domain-containing protein [Streptomyces sp. NPDC049590]|uniref:alkyl sulfatase dimerization domain-containing protein n=1 Tax=Streptomyces sp. NPDC049590 TaxID=3154834 RepID=UPI00344A3DE7
MASILIVWERSHKGAGVRCRVRRTGGGTWRRAASFAGPDNAEARALQADALEQPGHGSENGTWRNSRSPVTSTG